jgi:hypothetical protein
VREGEQELRPPRVTEAGPLAPEVVEREPEGVDHRLVLVGVDLQTAYVIVPPALTRSAAARSRASWSSGRGLARQR